MSTLQVGRTSNPVSPRSRTYRAGGHEKVFALSERGRVDSTQHSLHDFSNGDYLNDLPFRDRFEMVQEFVDDLRDRAHYTYGRVSTTGAGPVQAIREVGRVEPLSLINLASNDYLNLTRHPRVVAAAAQAAHRWGTGSGSAPMLAGTFEVHQQLEKSLARLKGTEAALLYSSGFGACYGVLSALLRPSDVAVIDMAAHASLMEGTRHTHRQLFRHNDPASLDRALAKVSKAHRNKVVICDGVYSMDGDIARLPELIEVARSYGALVVVDEAHATGVIGEHGSGTASHFGLKSGVDIAIGTCSKALGSIGGFATGSQELVNYLRMMSRPYIFSTAPSPIATASTLEALRVMRDEPELKENLWRNIRHFRQGLRTLGVNLGGSETAIFPVILGDDSLVSELCRRLHSDGVYASAVPYPAVPRRLGRVRLTVSAGLETAQLDRALEIIERHLRGLQIGRLGSA